MPPKKNSKVVEPEVLKVADPEVLKVDETDVLKVVKVTKSKKKEKEQNSEEKQADKPIEIVDKPKKKIKETVVEKVSESIKPIKPKKEIKSKKVVELIEHSVEEPKVLAEEVLDESDLAIRKELEEVKLSWLNKQNRLTEIEAEKSKIESDKQNDIKKLKELLDKIQTPNKQDEGFLIDNKVQLTNTKNNIIPVESDSDSDSDNDTSNSESESDKKPMLTKCKKQAKPLIKTTKGGSKNLKLSINDSGSESD
jgi:hypothetical protein